MKLKILALVGSYRKHGNTAAIVDLIGRRLEAIALENRDLVELDVAWLGHENILQCKGCRVCFDRSEMECPLKDDFLTLKQRITQADAVIAASPVYVNDVSGYMKTVIDRMAHVCHRPEFIGKIVYLVVTTGATSTSHAIQTMFLAWSTWGAYLVGKSSFAMGARMTRDIIEKRYGARILKIAGDVYNAVHNKQSLKPGFLPLLFFKIQQRGWSKEPDDSVDFAYWNKKGWLNPKAKYFFPPKTRKLVIVIARFIGGIIAPFVS